MQRLEIKKKLIVEEDLALEDSPLTQTRAGETFDVTPLKMFKIVKSVEELKLIDVNKFKQSVIFGAPEGAEINNIFYQWYPDNNLPEDVPHVVSSDVSPTGRWVEQVFVSIATFSNNFVTLNTPQYIERGADKQWLNNNIFFGDSSFGQIVLGADEESASLKMSFVDTRGKLFQQEAFIGFAALGDDDFVVVNNKEGGKIAFGNELTFLGDAKNINNVALAALPHQAVPKSQLDAAKDALEQAMQEMKQELEQQIDDLAADVQTNTESIAENATKIEQNKQDIASNASDIVQNTTRLDELSDRIDRITQTGVVVGQIPKTMAEVEVDRETILDAFVMERKSREPLEGDSIYTTDSHGYYRHATAWSDPYTISIGIATTLAPGLVKSVDNTDANRGKVKVDSSSGEMSMVKGEKLPYVDQANTFEQDNVFNKNLRVLQNLNVTGIAYASGASVGVRAPGDTLPQAEDQLLEVHSYNASGVPSRQRGLATYNKTVDTSGAYPCEIVNVDALQRYVGAKLPTDIARKTQSNDFTAANTFSAGLTVKNALTILDTSGSSDFDKAKLIVQGYVRARSSLTADKGLYAGMDHGDGDGGNALFRVQKYPENPSLTVGAYYNKVITNPSDDEIVNHKWLKDYVASQGGGSVPTNMVTTDTTQTITGTKTFTILPTSSVAPTSNEQLVNKKYVDDKVAAGGGGGSGDYVTLGTEQTITGGKTFTSYKITLPMYINIQNQTYFRPLGISSTVQPEVAVGCGLNFTSLRLSAASYSSSASQQISLRACSPNYSLVGYSCPMLDWSINGYNNFMLFTSYSSIKFLSNVTIQNASFGTRMLALDPVWEQDYATANYVNQKLQALYDHVDARLKALEEAAGLPSLARAGDSDMFKAALNKVNVQKSATAELLEELDNLEGYKGVIAFTTPEERLAIVEASDRAEQLRILDAVKERVEKEAANANQPV